MAVGGLVDRGVANNQMEESQWQKSEQGSLEGGEDGVVGRLVGHGEWTIPYYAILCHSIPYHTMP